MMEITARNTSEALVKCLEAIVWHGATVDSRAGRTKEICGMSIVMEKPLERCLLLPKRNDNIFAKIAETLWVISGRNDIEWLSYYLPRAGEFSDDGRTWRGGYGPRLRGSFPKLPIRPIDPLQEVVLLLQDHSTRRAVISLWDNHLDYVASKDIPCNDTLHFMIRDDKLNLYVFQRSCDAIWGFSGINAFEWATLMQMVAFWTHTEVGTLNYSISSMHVYEQHWKRAQEIIDNYDGWTAYEHEEDAIRLAGGFLTPFEYLGDELDKIFKMEKKIRVDDYDFDRDTIVTDPFLDNCIKMLNVYINYKDGDWINNPTPLRNAVDELPNNDFKQAAIEYLSRSGKSKA
jgi:thymidylate synthase